MVLISYILGIPTSFGIAMFLAGLFNRTIFLPEQQMAIGSILILGCTWIYIREYRHYNSKSIISSVFQHLNLVELKLQGINWGKQYKYLKSIVLFRAIPSISSDNEIQTKYMLYFKFKKTKKAKLEKDKFNELRWEKEAYPISECKDDIYETDPSEVDLLYEWNVVTEKPQAVNKRDYFVIFNR